MIDRKKREEEKNIEWFMSVSLKDTLFLSLFRNANTKEIFFIRESTRTFSM